MEPIDTSIEKLRDLVSNIDQYRETIVSEQDTRMKVINPILTTVLGWSLGDIHTEEPSGSGYIDYKLSISGLARLVVEAKRDGRELGLKNRTAGRSFKLNGAVFNVASAKEGIEQATRYCGQKNAELACVTNGREWIVFRGSRLGDGHDTMDGFGFVYPSLQDVISNFSRFYDLLSYDAVQEYKYRAIFQEAEGRPIRTHNVRKALHSSDSRRLISPSRLANDLDRVMSSFFRRLSGDDDPDLLVKCFVVTRESTIADQKIARISEDLIGTIRGLNTGNAEQLTEIVERVKSTHRNQFVILVGTKGAGKSTFIDRFFRHVLPRSLVEDCVVARVNLADSEGSEANITTWLDRHLLDALEQTVFSGEPPTFEELEGLFWDEYKRRKEGSLKPLYDSDKTAFQIEFGKHIERVREERPHEYIRRLVNHIVKSRKKVPCLIFDNADHFTIEFQEKVFQYARSIYEIEVCLVIMPITDRTSWQLSREGALRSFESESLFLPTPDPEMVLKKRIEFLENKLTTETKESGTGYFTNRGIRLSIENLTAFTASLQTVFLNTGQVAVWIGNLANNDVRRCLDVAKTLITSPHLEVEELITAYSAGSSMRVPPHKIKRALFRGQYDIYPAGVNSFVHNIFALVDEFDTSPLIGIRLLLLLKDAQSDKAQDAFVTIEQITEYCRAMATEPNAVMSWLGKMLEMGLCLSYDPTIVKIADVRKLELSPSGEQHLTWGIQDIDYIRTMMEVTPISDPTTLQTLQTLGARPLREVWHQELNTFIEYLLREDANYCKVPDHESYNSQKQLALDFQATIASNRPSD